MYCPSPELDEMPDAYCAMRGWDGSGVPTLERVRALGLDAVAGPPSGG